MSSNNAIDVKHLRIGNMVWRPPEWNKTARQLNDSGQYGRVTSIGPRAWTCDHRVKGVLCKPIAISEQLLKDFGFSACYVLPNHDIGPRTRDIYAESISIYKTAPFECFNIQIQHGIHLVYRPNWMLCAYDLISDLHTSVIYIGRVEFVHELQNKYFAMTGEDLLYKP